MRTFFLHASAPYVAVTISGGSKYFVRTAWATDNRLFDEPPPLPRTLDNYSLNPELYIVNSPSAASPMVLRADGAWWRQARGRVRILYALVQWRQNPGQPWVVLDTVEYVINHPPRAIAGPDQIAAIDAAGNLIADVRLDGTGSDDPDENAAVYPSGPLAYKWAAVQTPRTLVPADPVSTAAHTLGATRDPMFLSAGAAVPVADRGSFTFRLTVDDTETATLGTRAGQSLKSTSDTRVQLGVTAGAGLRVLSPTTSEPYFGNFEDGVDPSIFFTIDPALVKDKAYDLGWLVRCTVSLAVVSPLYPSGAPGDTVFEATTVARAGPVEVIRWNGRINKGAATGWKAVGAFTVKLDLLDSTGNLPPGIPFNTATQARALVMDGFRWILPVDAPFSAAILSGAFGESGHAGDLHTGLHTGADISVSPAPDIVAARSGFYPPVDPNGSGVHRIELRHAAPDRTQYLHADQLAPFAADELVLQGARLGTMSNVSPVNLPVHLHFEYRVQGPAAPGPIAINPLAIIPLRDVFAPEVEGVFLRQSPAIGPADMSNARVGISGSADLVVRCRDYGHPDRVNVPLGTLVNGPYSVGVIDQSGAVLWPRIQTGAIPDPGDAQRVAITHLSDVFALQADYLPPPPEFPRTRDNHYLLFLRWDCTASPPADGPLALTVSVADFSGARRSRVVRIGPEAKLHTQPPDPATTSASPKAFSFDIEIVNRTYSLNGDHSVSTDVMTLDGYPVRRCTDWISSDDCHLSLSGAPAGWTISPTRTGPLPNGATAANPQGGVAPPTILTVTIDPNGLAAAGTHAFEVVASSGILRPVGHRIPVSVRVS